MPAQISVRVIGQPVLVDMDGVPIAGLRKKDIALAVYLWHSAERRHGRSFLAALLWGDSTERRARHSLTQSLVRLQRVLPESCLAISRSDVQWLACAPSDLEQSLQSDTADFTLNNSIFTGEAAFLSGFLVGEGAEDFDRWADETRAAYHHRITQLLDVLGRKAEAAHDWNIAIRSSEAGIRLDSFAEEFHRRLMRAWAARGERNLAIRHYSELCIKWARELGREPDPATKKLSEEIAAARSTPKSVEQKRDHGDVTPPPVWADPRNETRGPSDANFGLDFSSPPPAEGEATVFPVMDPSRIRRGRFLVSMLILAFGLLGVAITFRMWRGQWLTWGFAERSEAVRYPDRPFKISGDTLIYFARGQYFWAYPDMRTFRACNETGTVDERKLAPPLLFGGVLPSVQRFPWLSTESAVTSADDPTVYIIRHCIRRGVPSPEVLKGLIGDDPWSKVIVVADTILRKIPFGLSADLGPIVTPLPRLKGQHTSGRVPTPSPYRSAEAHRKERAARIQ